MIATIDPPGAGERAPLVAVAMSLALSLALHVAALVMLILLRVPASRLLDLEDVPITVAILEYGREVAGPGERAPDLREGVPPDPGALVVGRPEPPAAVPAMDSPAVADPVATPPSEPVVSPPAIAEPPPLPTRADSPKLAAKSEPKPAPKSKPPAKAAPPAKSAAKPAAAPNAPPASASTPPAATAGTTGQPGGGGTGRSGAAAGAPSWAPTMRVRYEQQLFAWLTRHKSYPLLAKRRGLEGKATVRVRIDRRGHVLGQDLVQPTGERVLDSAAQDMVRRSSPFPPVPDDYPEETFEFRAPIQFDLR